MNKFYKVYDRILNIFVIIAGIILVYMMLSVCWDVVMRYAFNRPSLWVVDVAAFGQLFLCFLVAAWVLKLNGHVKIDLILNALSPRAQLWLNASMYIIALIVFLVITIFSAQTEWVLYKTQFHVNAVTRPLKYIIYFIIPLGSLLVCIQLFRLSIDCFKKLKEPHR